MRATLALVLALATDPVQAHCYSHWYYPWPQSCRSTPARAHHPFIAEAPPTPPAAVMATDENSERAQAIEALKDELREAEALKLELQDIGLTKMEDKQ